MDLSLMNRKQLRGEVFETKLGFLQAKFYYQKAILWHLFFKLLNRKKSWRDDELSGIKRKSNTTDGLPSKRMVSSEYSRCVLLKKEISLRTCLDLFGILTHN